MYRELDEALDTVLSIVGFVYFIVSAYNDDLRGMLIGLFLVVLAIWGRVYRRERRGEK